MQNDPPTRRLPDGVVFYGRLGAIAYDADADRVQCHLCGGWYRQVGGSHLLRTHGWTLDEYRDAFHLPRLAPTCASGVSTALRRRASARLGNKGFGVGGPSRKGAKQGSLRPWQLLAARAPELLVELHPTRNDNLDPPGLAGASNRRVWWRCQECGHEWRALVSSRTAGHGCPECGRRRATGAMAATKRRAPSNESLSALRPDLLAIWDYVLNRQLDPSTIGARSSQRVWWRCLACNEAWQTTENNRARAGHYLCTRARREGAQKRR